eukprot:CAMPEP_0177601026 /NCGR_PEP_ID=MMETSP0419_2-20121207/14003_1 /TAXON_ID=582737 /ORGANISM="Tetraselmis sp., Strain GSL018" /LENGTH=419 /DNA_ID=CAMNT_0019094191 /DNA_START=474 /DNA_END=1734 /DNA_ORIENTATION=+
MKRDIERGRDFQSLHHICGAGGTDDQEPPPLWGRPPEKEEQRLQDLVRVDGPDAAEAEDPLEVVDDQAGEGARGGVVKGLLEGRAPLRRARGHHRVRRADDARKRELGLRGDGGGERRLPGAGRTLEQRRQHRVACGPHPRLGNQAAAGRHERVELRPEGEHPVREPSPESRGAAAAAAAAAQRGSDLREGVLKVLTAELDPPEPEAAPVLPVGLRRVVARRVEKAVVRVRGRGADQAGQLGSTVVPGHVGQRPEVDVFSEHVVLGHLPRVDGEDLVPPARVGEADLHLHLEAPPVEQVLAVGEADDEDVGGALHAVHLCQQLVHDGVAHAGAALVPAPRLAQSVDLVKDDHVELRVVPLPRVLVLGCLKQRPDVRLALPHPPLKELGPVDDLRLAVSGEQSADLSCDERLSRARGPVH